MMCFGAIVGVGWITILGQWLSLAGPGGTVVALIIGAAAMLVVASGYGLLARANRLCAVGEIGAVGDSMGAAGAFAVTAALALAGVGVVAFEAVSAGWVSVTLFPSLEGPALYRVLGTDVHLGTVAVALLGTGTVAVLNLRPISRTARTQNNIVFLKIGITTIFCVAGLVNGDPRNLLPLLPRSTTGSGVSAVSGVLAVAATMPLWFAGFHVAAVLCAERDSAVSAASVGRVMYGAILASCLFYICVVLAASYVVPWQTLISAPLPAAAAFREGLSSPLLANLVLTSGLLGICSAWIACFAAAVRVLNVLRWQLRGGTTAGFAGSGSDSLQAGTATFVITSVAATLSLAGRAALVPIVNVAALCFGIVYMFVSIVAWRYSIRPLQRYRSAVGVCVAAFMAAYVLISAVEAGGWMAPEMVVTVVWVCLGTVSWLCRSKDIAHAI